MKNMINIIKDFDDILNKKGAIEVIDDSSFLISRMMISDQKEKRFKDDIDIIIKNSKYQFGYNDLNHLKDFVIFGEINLVEILEEQLSIDLKGLSNRDILSTGINKNLQIFINSYDKKYNYFQNVIMFNFEIEDTDDLKHMDKAIKFILDNIKMIEKMKENRNSTLQYLKNEIKDLSSREDFLWFINILDYDTDVKEYMKIIIFNHIFKNYKEFEKEILNKPKGYRNIDIS
ncbi:MAG: hypothetical protein GX987_03885, partial [Tissierellia bacterium]|nr:hypothetical protein [Tissierellia bacterium]